MLYSFVDIWWPGGEKARADEQAEMKAELAW